MGGDLYVDLPAARFQRRRGRADCSLAGARLVKENTTMTETHPVAPHDTSTRFYWLVGAALAVITIVEVAVSLNGVIVSHENPDFTSQIILLAILLVLSVIKGG